VYADLYSKRGIEVEADEGMIRPVRPNEIEDLSALIRNTLLISNSMDYDMLVIRNLSRQYAQKNVADMALRREMFIHMQGGRITGTVSLKDDTIFAFFVAPDRQRSGIGSRLLSFVEERARGAGMSRLKVGASLTAKDFYEAHGYSSVRKEGDESYGDVFYMEKML
jgi:GNAT superfamily N-acetyltransferase